MLDDGHVAAGSSERNLPAGRRYTLRIVGVMTGASAARLKNQVKALAQPSTAPSCPHAVNVSRAKAVTALLKLLRPGWARTRRAFMVAAGGSLPWIGGYGRGGPRRCPPMTSKARSPGTGLLARRRVVPAQALRRSLRLNGSTRTRLPVAAATALATAGPIGGTPGSPTPVGFSVDGTMWTSTTGISSMRKTS